MNIHIHLKNFAYKWKTSTDRQWIQFAIVAVVVLTSTIVSYWGSLQIFVLLLALLGGTATLMLLLRQLNVGFIFLLLASIFIPFSGPGGVNAAILMVGLILALWLLDMLVVQRFFHFIKSRTLLPATAFIVVSVVAFAMGQVPWFRFANQAPLDAQIGGFAVFILSFGLMIATPHLIRNVKWLQTIVWMFLVLGVLLVIGRTFSLPFTGLYQQGFTAQSMLWTWLVALLFSQLVFNTKLRWSIRCLLLLLLVMTFYVVMVRQNAWKSGWVPAVLVVIVLVGVRFPKLARFAIPFVLIAAIYAAQDLISTDQYSWDTRLEAWLIVLDISRVSPIIGLGFANYYWYAPLFPIRGYYTQFNSHSQYVDIIAQTGILGLFCYLWLLFEVGRLAWRLAHQLPEGFARAYVYGIFAGVIGSLLSGYLADWLLPFVYNIGLNGFRASFLPWLFFGGLISIERIYLASLGTGTARNEERANQT
ncbi:MAG: O-antigen ligase family protein [Anaerolineae bacterium]|nr:O-antigen ligase family protein [Anaerolineae bacterium]